MMSKYKQFPDRNIEDLLNAVVVRAAEDYREAYVTLMKRDSSRARAMLKETEEFFRSDGFRFFTEADGPKILSMLEQERQECEKLIPELLNARKRMASSWQYFCRSGKKDDHMLDSFLFFADSVKALVEQLPSCAVRRVPQTEKVLKLLERAEKWKEKLNKEAAQAQEQMEASA